MQRSVDESDDQQPAFIPMPSTSSKSPLRPPVTSSECEVSILKAIDNQNNAAIPESGVGSCEVDADVSGLVVDTMPELLSPGGMVKKDASSSAGVAACSPRPGGSSGQQQQVKLLLIIFSIPCHHCNLSLLTEHVKCAYKLLCKLRLGRFQ